MKRARKKRNAKLSRGYYTIENQDTPSPKMGDCPVEKSSRFAAGVRFTAARQFQGKIGAFPESPREPRRRGGGRIVDSYPSQLYTFPMISAYPRLMADSRGLAVGLEGMRVR